MADQQKFRLTAQKLEALKLELEGLKTKGRQEITDRLQDIQSQVIEELDSPYVEASDERDILEARIVEIEKIIENSEVIDKSQSIESIDIGSTVKVRVDGVVREYMLVEEIEADPLNGKIAQQSPVGAALHGKRVGDQVDVDVNGKIISYKVVEIS
jgi:transcription elongation factor GreA